MTWVKRRRRWISPPWTEASGWLTAFDASTGNVRWRYHAAKPMFGGVLATAGNLVFTGELDGTFEVFDARTGNILFKSGVAAATCSVARGG